MTLTVPATVTVAELLSSRYPANERPSSWDERRAGIDSIRDNDGRTLLLWSDGQQSPPKAGWKIVLTQEEREKSAAGECYRWTLYGIRED